MEVELEVLRGTVEKLEGIKKKHLLTAFKQVRRAFIIIKCNKKAILSLQYTSENKKIIIIKRLDSFNFNGDLVHGLIKYLSFLSEAIFNSPYCASFINSFFLNLLRF